jgi:hypothetical protein
VVFPKLAMFLKLVLFIKFGVSVIRNPVLIRLSKSAMFLKLVVFPVGTSQTRCIMEVA